MTESELMRGTLYDIGTEAETILDPASVDRLIELGIARIDDDRHLQLTAYGEKCVVVLESRG
jgi:hypothetical protein